MRVQDLIKDLEEIAEEHPEAVVKVDPPYHNVMAAYYREQENVVELTH